MDTHGEDGLGESHYPEITDGTINTDGVGFLARTLHEAAQKEEPVSIIALGPLTNLARLVQNDPESLAGLGELISMGGSCQSHGNCSQSTTTGAIRMPQKLYIVHLKNCLFYRTNRFTWWDWM